jgi:shikimate dehydrogenase
MLPLESPAVDEVVEFVRRHDIRGLAVTRPHKEAIVPLLDGLDATARCAGAVNTVVRDHSRLIGWNTDLVAMRTLLREWSAGPDDRAVVLGAGGAARAVVAALAEREVPVILVNRDRTRAGRLADDFAGVQVAGGPEALEALEAAAGTIFVQATPLGAGGETVPVPGWLAPGGRVLDLAYRDGGTPLETAARAAGHRVVGGHDFLARQGAAQFALWTGRLVNADLFREALGVAGPAREAAC